MKELPENFWRISSSRDFENSKLNAGQMRYLLRSLTIISVPIMYRST